MRRMKSILGASPITFCSLLWSPVALTRGLAVGQARRPGSSRGRPGTSTRSARRSQPSRSAVVAPLTFSPLPPELLGQVDHRPPRRRRSPHRPFASTLGRKASARSSPVAPCPPTGRASAKEASQDLASASTRAPRSRRPSRGARCAASSRRRRCLSASANLCLTLAERVSRPTPAEHSPAADDPVRVFRPRPQGCTAPRARPPRPDVVKRHHVCVADVGRPANVRSAHSQPVRPRARVDSVRVEGELAHIHGQRAVYQPIRFDADRAPCARFVPCVIRRRLVLLGGPWRNDSTQRNEGDHGVQRVQRAPAHLARGGAAA